METWQFPVTQVLELGALILVEGTGQLVSSALLHPGTFSGCIPTSYADGGWSEPDGQLSSVSLAERS